MNLVIDIGNTRTKFSVFNRGEVLITVPVEEFLPSHIDVLHKEYDNLDKVILSTVKSYSEELKTALQFRFDTFIELNEDTPVITSYSIHYTKLYEGNSQSTFGGLTENDQSQGNRITSYNVCYTKLLRPTKRNGHDST